MKSLCNGRILHYCLLRGRTITANNPDKICSVILNSYIIQYIFRSGEMTSQQKQPRRKIWPKTLAGRELKCPSRMSKALTQNPSWTRHAQSRSSDPSLTGSCARWSTAPWKTCNDARRCNMPGTQTADWLYHGSKTADIQWEHRGDPFGLEMLTVYTQNEHNKWQWQNT